MKLSVREMTMEAFENLEKELRASHIDISAMQETWQSLDAYFRNSSLAEDERFRWTYFRIYTELTWKMFGAQNPDFIVNMAIARQIPMALQLDFNVFESIVSYLGSQALVEAEVQSLYLKIQKAFLESEAVIGVWQGENITVSEVIKEINSVYNSGDSLEQADFESRLLQIMFSNEEAEKYSTVDPEDGKGRFLDLVSFFQTFAQEDISYIVDSLLNPEKYENNAAAQEELSPESEIEETSESAAVAPQPASSRLESKSAFEQTSVVEPPARLAMAQIKSQIESQFKKDTEGNFVDLEGVMAKLSELADKYNDPKIVEAIYFDEQDNKFKWNI
ncbi:MAG TPA: hypothetical protein VLK22_04450 [Candidatus Udaeobacter sp.]|nr:hypothetical protein [Candidatus Udaeobacter sp.]